MGKFAEINSSTLILSQFSGTSKLRLTEPPRESKNFCSSPRIHKLFSVFTIFSYSKKNNI